MKEKKHQGNKQNNGIKPVISAMMSAVLWGSGQFMFCKQYLKGIFLFLLQFSVIAIELCSGYLYETMLGLVPDFDIRLHGGFFTKGVWGFFTLGNIPREDHSILLLVRGVIAILLLTVVVIIWIWNIYNSYKTTKEFDPTKQHPSSKEYAKKTLSKYFPQIVLTPMGILFVAVTVMPIIVTILIAFTNYSRTKLPPANIIDWVGLNNFKNLFNVPIWSSTFFNILLWTVIWAVSVTLLSYFIGMFQAVLLNSVGAKSRKFYQSIMILPWAVPSMVTLLYLRSILNGQFGQLNMFLRDMGIIDSPIPFLSDPLIARIVLIAVAVFLSYPSFMLMMLGVFSSTDESWYEAAKIDGANRWQQFRHITFPHVFTATAPLLIMSFAGNFNGFGIIYFITGGGPVNPDYQFAGDTDILISWIYDLTLNHQMYSMASVMTILIFIFIGIISVWNLRRTNAFKEI